MLKIWRIGKIEIWSEELVDGHQKVPYQPKALFAGVNYLIVFPNNSLLMFLQLSFTPIHVSEYTIISQPKTFSWMFCPSKDS